MTNLSVLPPKPFWLIGLLFLVTSACSQEGKPIDTIELPPGFSIDVFADNVPNARAMVLGDKGTLFVGSRQAGTVYAIVPDAENQKAEKVFVIAKGLTMPSGVAFKDGSLYVSEVSRILKFEEIENQLENPPEAKIIMDTLPTETHHGWKFIAFGPDGLLYVPVGAPCNVCKSDDPRFASILRMKADGSQVEIYAQGIRNSVGFDWHPTTKTLWFTDNGRDWLGDDIPPDELNHAPRAGMHFGFPYCHGGTLLDSEYSEGRSCEEFSPPQVQLGPHVASLGMRFYDKQMFPEPYRGKIFIAEHGSWNRSMPIGYRVTMVDPDHNSQKSYQPFAKGWLQGFKAWGRPADVLVMPDGALLVSDDYAGAIYRISYAQPG